MSAPHPFLTYWHQALATPFGVSIRFLGDPASIKTALYTARAKANDPLLASVSIRTSPRSPSDELWLIVDRTAKAELIQSLGAPA